MPQNCEEAAPQWEYEMGDEVLEDILKIVICKLVNVCVRSDTGKLLLVANRPIFTNNLGYLGLRLYWVVQIANGSLTDRAVTKRVL